MLGKPQHGERRLTYSSTDVKTKADANDVNLIVIGSGSMTKTALS